MILLTAIFQSVVQGSMAKPLHKKKQIWKNLSKPNKMQFAQNATLNTNTETTHKDSKAKTEYVHTSYHQQQKIWNTFTKINENNSFKLARSNPEAVKQHLDNLKKHTRGSNETDKLHDIKYKVAIDTTLQRNWMNDHFDPNTLLDQAAKQAGRDT